MSESRVEKVGARLQEEASAFISYPEIARLSEERGFPTSVRTIRFYVNEGVLPAPRKSGNTPGFPRGEILALLFSIHVMKSRFGRSLATIRRILHQLTDEPEVLADKLALLYEEVGRDGRQRVEYEWLIDTWFATLDGACDLYPLARRGQPGPRAPEDVLLTELLDDLEHLARWERDRTGEPIWRSPTDVLMTARTDEEATMSEIRPSNGERAPSVTPLALPEGAVDVDEARRREEQFLRRFEQNLSKFERIHSPAEKKTYAVRPGTLDPQIEDPYQRVVDLLKEKGLYDRSLLERLPHDRCTRFTLPPPGLFGRKSPKLVVSGVALSPIDQLASVGGAVRPLGEPDLARVIRDQVRHRGAYHVIGVLSTVGWDPELFRSPPHQEDLAVVLIERDEIGGWRLSHSLPKDLAGLAIAYDPETLDEKVRRAFYRVMEHPELKIPGGHVEVERFLEEIELPREVLDLAMKQVTHEDPRLKFVQVSERELIKRDRF